MLRLPPLLLRPLLLLPPVLLRLLLLYSQFGD